MFSKHLSKNLLHTMKRIQISFRFSGFLHSLRPISSILLSFFSAFGAAAAGALQLGARTDGRSENREKSRLLLCALPGRMGLLLRSVSPSDFVGGQDRVCLVVVPMCYV